MSTMSELAMDRDTIARLGHNSPPTPIETAGETMTALSNWMKDHPVIESEEDAREAKLLCDRGVDSLAEVEVDRVAKVGPLNEMVAKYNLEYKALHNTDKKKPGRFDRILNELKGRVNAFLLLEEARRVKAAQEAAAKAAEAEKTARDAEAREKEQLANAKGGELDIDVGQVTAEADAAFDAFERAAHVAAVANRDSHVKLGGGFSRAMSLRTKETLVIDDALSAIMCIGVTEGIREAILTAARVFRTEHNGELPSGVRSETNRSI